MRGCKGLAATGAAGLAFLVASAGWAQTVGNCSDTTMFPNPIYLTGSTAYEPTAGLFAVQMAMVADPNLKATIIYQDPGGSCDAPPAIMNGTMLAGTAVVWSPGPNFANDVTNVVKSNCTLDSSHTADVGVSDIFWDSCPNLAGVPQPTTIKDVKGPAQAMVFVVSAANTTFTAMSAETAQLIWGCGMSGMVSPFTDNNGIIMRGPASGTQGIIAKAINVPTTAFFGVMATSGGNVLKAMNTYVGSHDPTKTIGFIAADLFDSQTTLPVAPVALRGFNQKMAYYADTNPRLPDRKNVRDGHYVAWGPEHFFVTVDSTTGAITNPAAAKFIGATFGTMYQSSFDYLRLQSLAGVIPQCAMQVTRNADGGPILPKTDNTDPCGCFYEKTRLGTTTCTACPNGNADCTGGKTCHHGYCE